MASFPVRIYIYAIYVALIIAARWIYHRPTFNKLTFNIKTASTCAHRTFSAPSKIKDGLQLDILDEKTIIVSWLWKGGDLYGYFYTAGLPIPSREFKIAERINHPYTVFKYGSEANDIGVIYQSSGSAWIIPSPSLKNNSQIERQFLPISRGFNQLRFGESHVYAYNRDSGLLTTYYFSRHAEGGSGQSNFSTTEETRAFIGYSITDFYVADHYEPLGNHGTHTIRGGCQSKVDCRDGKFTSFMVKSGSYPLLTFELMIGLLLFPLILSIPTFIALILPKLADR
jgi:hypothetical protein